MLTRDLFAVANLLVLFSQQYAFLKTVQKSNWQQSAKHTGIVSELYFRNRVQYSSVQSSAVEQVFDYYPRRAHSALGVDTVLTLDVCMFVCMLGL